MSSFVRKGTVLPARVLQSEPTAAGAAPPAGGASLFHNPSILPLKPNSNSLPSAASASLFSASALPPPRLNSPGVRPWLNGTAFLSSGCSTFDSAIGGGFFLNSFNLLREDYSNHFEKFIQVFLADGISYSQNIIFISPSEIYSKYSNSNKQENSIQSDNSASSSSSIQSSFIPTSSIEHRFLQKLPRNITLEKRNPTEYSGNLENSLKNSLNSSSSSSSLGGEENEESLKNSQTSEDLKIAWRYSQYLNPSGNSTKLNSQSNSSNSRNSTQESRKLKESSGKSSSSQSLSFTYDFSLALDPKLINEAKEKKSLRFIQVNSGDYQSLLQSLLENLTSLHESRPGSVTRIILLGVGGLGWRLESSSDSGLIKFFSLLRPLTARFPSVCLATLPNHIYSAEFTQRLAYFADSFLLLDSLDHDEVFADFSALLTIEKFPRINSLIGIPPEARQFLVKARRKLMVEKLALPPELSRNEESQGMAAAKNIQKSNNSKPEKPTGGNGRIEFEGENSNHSHSHNHNHSHNHSHSHSHPHDQKISAAQIVRSRGTGCSSTHELGGDLDF